MSEHTCRVAFNAIVPEVALDMSSGGAALAVIVQVVVFPVVAQRQIPSQLPYIWWSMFLLCSSSSFNPVVAQRPFPWSKLLCGLRRFPNCSLIRWSMFLLCSCSPVHMSLQTRRCAMTGAGWIPSAEYCGSSAVAVLRVLLHPCRGAEAFQGLADHRNSPNALGYGGRFSCYSGRSSSTVDGRGGDSRAPTVAAR